MTNRQTAMDKILVAGLASRIAGFITEQRNEVRANLARLFPNMPVRELETMSRQLCDTATLLLAHKVEKKNGKKG